MSGLLDGLEERLEQWAGSRTPLQLEGALAAPPVVLAGQAGLHPLEVREAVRPVPLLATRRCRPAVEVHRVAPLEDHPVDGRRAAQDLAAGVVHPAATHLGFRFGLVHPVVEPVADSHRQGGRHVDDHVGPPVAPTGLDQEYPVGRIGTQAVGQRTARRTTPDDHEVVAIRHLVPSGRVALWSGPAIPRFCPNRVGQCSPVA